MDKVDAALIGGTGIGGLLDELAAEPISVETPYGAVSGRVAEWSGRSVLLLRRHSGGHSVPPHKVNYRGVAGALRSLSVRACVSSAAVGSLRTDWGPGTLAACDDMVDLTFRRLTMFEDEVVHTDFSTPFPLSRPMCEAGGAEVQPSATYFGLDGPRYETPAEVRMCRQLGGDVVGMTASSEAIVLRECGVPYGCLAVVTNLGCGLSGAELHHGEVVDVMKAKGPRVLEILMKTIELAV